ncbi:YdcF family protein [Oscillibacter hominis]|uniref:YdcF family protein n=1 Tax=Oscillibacter hominis TaxID=2763056 RepID=A0A7G9B6X4_9FIRM|nr:YdcF family protein [Oscillibacter hominis]QNL45305.1 YdcF family protein [Oscillibacter hominis]
MKGRWCAALMCALAGALLTVVRVWGMRFSGWLLLGAAAVIALSALIDARAEKGQPWRWLRRAFYGALSMLLVLLTSIEVYVVSKGREDFTALPSEAVIVLGAGVNGREPSLALKSRLDAALAYLEEHPDIPVVLTGGKGYGEEITEARCMYDYLTGHGVEGERLILEEQALNTAENFACSRALLSERGVDVENGLVAVVTNDFHVARSKLIAQRQGVRMLGVPAPLPWKHLSVNYYLRESFAMVKTFLFD